MGFDLHQFRAKVLDFSSCFQGRPYPFDPAGRRVSFILYERLHAVHGACIVLLWVDVKDPNKHIVKGLAQWRQPLMRCNCAQFHQFCDLWVSWAKAHPVEHTWPVDLFFPGV